MVILGSNFIANRRTLNPSPSFDTDAEVYISSVEASDGQPLEDNVKNAINAFVVGCKSDGIWDAIKACCILSGARTLSGALTPLKGVAPTNFNFVSADYNRKTGLKGNGINKYLNTNRYNNADPQDANHNSIFSSESVITNSNLPYMGSGSGTGRNTINTTSNNSLLVSSRNIGSIVVSGESAATGFKGISRNASSNFSLRSSGNTTFYNLTSQTPSSGGVLVFRSLTAHSTTRQSFYSIGESINLEMLDNRVTILMNAFNTLL